MVERSPERDSPREQCGVFGIWLPGQDNETIADIVFAGTLQNQHRGEESVGIAIGNGRQVFEPFTHMGLVRDGYLAYKEQGLEFKGNVGIGHNRYSTTGSSRLENAAPFRLEELAVSHNGNLTNASELRRELIEKGVKLLGTTDSEIIPRIIATASGNTLEERMISGLQKLQGSFSLTICTKDALYAARDSLGNRPLHFGVFEYNGELGFAISSETPAFDSLGIHYREEVKPGELIRFDTNGIERWQFAKETNEAFCGLEIAYLLRADGRFRNVQVDTIRRCLGAKLAKEYPVPDTVDFVTYIPESSKSTAEGYAEELSRELGRPIFPRTSMLKGRYGDLRGALRGFINPDDSVREAIGRNNYFPFDWLVGKRIVMVDDSIIRGRTTQGVMKTVRERVGNLRNNGAKEIHLRIPWPPVLGPCPLGTDIRESDWLVYRELGQSIEEVRKYLEVSSLAYLTPQEFQEAVDEVAGEYVGLCKGCVDGQYPVTVYQADKAIFERE